MCPIQGHNFIVVIILGLCATTEVCSIESQTHANKTGLIIPESTPTDLYSKSTSEANIITKMKRNIGDLEVDEFNWEKLFKGKGGFGGGGGKFGKGGGYGQYGGGYGNNGGGFGQYGGGYQQNPWNKWSKWSINNW